uniref:Uncharacterized protein n=1 Tax=Oryza glumipatula TaxID=40148 RepID=A0A0D9ZJS0_9ORYZ
MDSPVSVSELMRREQENAGATSALLAGEETGRIRKGGGGRAALALDFSRKSPPIFRNQVYAPHVLRLKRENRGQGLFCNMWKTRGFFAKKHPLPRSRSLSLSRAVASAFPSRRARRRAPPPPPPHRAATSAQRRPHRRPPPTPPRAASAASPSLSPSAAVSASATATAVPVAARLLRRHRQRPQLRPPLPSKKRGWSQSRRRWLRDGEAEAVQMQCNFWLLAARHFSLRLLE